MKIETGRLFLILLLGTLLALLSWGEAQQPKKIPQVGFLSVNSSQAMVTRVEAFREGLRDLGYVEGQNIIIDWRFADLKPDRLSELAAELVRLNVKVIVTGGPPATRPAREATATIPIVMAQDGNPVAAGFVASLTRPGGNITGLSTISAKLYGKRLEMLKKVIPQLSRVMVFGNQTNPDNVPALREMEGAARALGLKLNYFEVWSLSDVHRALKSAAVGQPQALVALGNPFGFTHRSRLLELVAKSRLPAIYWDKAFAEAGGLMSYAANMEGMFRRAAVYVDKILRGAKPADLPVEQPTKFELVINLKTAKALGLRIPPEVLTWADEVIK